jgi:hypothetical protein
MPLNTDQENYIKNIFNEIEQIELNNENWNTFITNLNENILAIDNCINEEINLWINNNHKIRLIILAEAPISFDKFFYNRPGNFLNGLKNYYVTDNGNLKNVLRQNGIFVLDVYRFPIKPIYYTDNAGGVLFDEVYLNNKFNYLKNIGLINENTKIVFRYQQLIQRYVIIQNNNITNNYLTNIDGNAVSLYTGGEFGIVTLSTEVIDFLENFNNL